MNKMKLLTFLAKAHKNTYAAPKEIREKHKCNIPILKGHTDYDFSDDKFSYHDSYAGSTWAPGREVVFYNEEPIWCMSYQGQSVSDIDESFFQNDVFPFLKKALTHVTEDMPFRGPSMFVDGDFTYTFTIKGDYQYFTGQEIILYKGKKVFFQDVMGSLIK